ncbi:ABC transporter permease [Paenibacillus fonticola]|uniref:ABC transporter permease n=1 Tax=Paenibacillus fonticola TaxID=379896 RepID=UPI000374C64B|nr:ABC transporter permease [Paenibacillus fonticola]
MLKLVKLELTKYPLKWYGVSAIIANLSIIILITLVSYFEPDSEIVFKNVEEALVVLSSFLRATFVILAAVLIAKLIIEEYKNKTISVLFTYPINRKKMFGVKLLLIALLTFIALFASNLFSAGVFLLINSYLQIVPGTVNQAFLLHQVLSILTFSIATAGTGLIPLYFGLRKHSMPATILSSLLIVAFTSAHNPSFSLASIVYIPLALAIVGVMIASWAIRNVDKVDLT